MLPLQSHHITDLYCWVDDLLPKKKVAVGRPTILSDSELLTMLIWNTLTLKQKTLKDLYQSVGLYHQKDFPKLPKYNAFLEHAHRLLPVSIHLLQQLLCDHEPVRFMDSTMLPVCRLKRADTHKVALGLAQFGKNHQGWHYGFKLHASIDGRGKLCGIVFTPANVHDAQMMTRILNEKTRLAVGDGGYTARVMQRHIWETYGTVILSPPHPTQKKKIMAPWQKILLAMRSKIESVFDCLKEHLFLVTSFPRSVTGYLLHYIRVLLAYQVLALAKN